jgi:hypothetical protein
MFNLEVFLFKLLWKNDWENEFILKKNAKNKILIKYIYII